MFGSRSKADLAEFEAAALPHLNDIYRTAAHLLGNRTEAEDLAQDVFLQAWKSFHKFEVGTNCRAWLFKILFYRIHHHRRKWFQLKTVQEENFLEQTLRYQEPLPDRLTDEEVLAALDKLSPDFRAVVLLADVEEFAYKEIAEMLGIPIGTVMSRLSRARSALREQLAAMGTQMGLHKAKEARKGGEA